MEQTDATAISGVYTEVSSSATIQNSMQAVTGMAGALTGGIVLALVITLIKRISRRVARGKSGV